jgi:phosphatidylserine synthase
MGAASFVRTAGLWLIIGAFLGLCSGVSESVFPSGFGTPLSMVTQTLFVLSSIFTLIGMIGLARSGAAGERWLAKIGIGITLLTSALLVPLGVMVTLAAQEGVGDALLTPTVTAQALGLLLVGIAVVRARRWQSWQRYTPLLCGLYPFLVMIPVFMLSGGPNFWVIAAWQIPFVLLGLALYQQGAARAAAPAVATS